MPRAKGRPPADKRPGPKGSCCLGWSLVLTAPYSPPSWSRPEGTHKLPTAGTYLPVASGAVCGAAAVQLQAEAASQEGVEAASQPVPPQEFPGRQSCLQSPTLYPVLGGTETLHSDALWPSLLLGVHYRVVQHQDGVSPVQGEAPTPEAGLPEALPLTRTRLLPGSSRKWMEVHGAVSSEVWLRRNIKSSHCCHLSYYNYLGRKVSGEVGKLHVGRSLLHLI